MEDDEFYEEQEEPVKQESKPAWNTNFNRHPPNAKLYDPHTGTMHATPPPTASKQTKEPRTNVPSRKEVPKVAAKPAKTSNTKKVTQQGQLRGTGWGVSVVKEAPVVKSLEEIEKQAERMADLAKNAALKRKQEEEERLAATRLAAQQKLRALEAKIAMKEKKQREQKEEHEARQRNASAEKVLEGKLSN